MFAHPGQQAQGAGHSLRDMLQGAGVPQGPATMDLCRLPPRRLMRGERLFRTGDPFISIYIVRRGFFKTRMVDGDGREQVTGFFMAGDLLGLDGLAGTQHGVEAIALEESDVGRLAFALLEMASRENPTLHRELNAELAREILRHHETMMLLGSMVAHERLAAFLLDMSRRFASRGYSASEFVLRMTRGEIASFLGLQLETASRLFSSLAKDGVIEVRNKHVRIVDAPGLARRLKAAS
jgi:CRP/FNR family transcriptional regulator